PARGPNGLPPDPRPIAPANPLPFLPFALYLFRPLGAPVAGSASLGPALGSSRAVSSHCNHSPHLRTRLRQAASEISATPSSTAQHPNWRNEHPPSTQASNARSRSLARLISR